MTTREVPVACRVCRRRVATHEVKDNGMRIYPCCKDCLEGLHRPTVLRDDLPTKRPS